MKDVFGNVLAIDDTVTFTEPGYVYTLQTGTVVKFTDKKLVISWTDKDTSPSKPEDRLTYKFPKQVAKKVTK